MFHLRTQLSSKLFVIPKNVSSGIQFCCASGEKHGIIGIVTGLGFRNPRSQWITRRLLFYTMFISPRIQVVPKKGRNTSEYFGKSRDTVVSRAKFTRSARWTVYLYARPKVETSRDYQIITADPIELIISLIDSAYPNYIIKICFLLYVLYEKSYYNVKYKNKKIYLMYVRMSSFKF